MRRLQIRSVSFPVRRDADRKEQRRRVRPSWCILMHDASCVSLSLKNLPVQIRSNCSRLFVHTGHLDSRLGRMTTGLVLLVCSAVLAAAAAAQNQKLGLTPEWDFRSEDRTRGCANLTLVLDNWKYAIVTQVKDLLLHDHSTVLPDYGRIQPLSEALGDLYGEFNALKQRLTALTARFDGVESFVDDVWGRSHRRGKARPRGSTPPPRHTEATAPDAGGRPDGRRTRVVVRRIKKPAASHRWQ